MGANFCQIPSKDVLTMQMCLLFCFRYHIAVIVLIYLLPLMVMFVAYSIIGITLWSSAVPGNHINRALYEHQVNAKKKVRGET